MKVLIACKRGNISERDKWGHCLCADCKDYRYKKQQVRLKESGYTAIWRNNNKDKTKLYTKKWNENNKEKRRAIELSWKKRNPDKVKLYSNKAGRKWAKNNRGSRNAISMRRTLSLINRTPSWADLRKIKQFYIDADRLTVESGVPHEVDHIVPLQGKHVSGLHVHNNLQILTRFRNRSKQNKMEELQCVSL